MTENHTNEPISRGRTERNHGAWIGGVILIVLGVIFLLQNTIGFTFDNWWALFILIPAFSSFDHAYGLYREDGRLSARARGQAVSGFIFTFVALAFLVGGFGSWWPVLLIVGGLALLANALLPD